MRNGRHILAAIAILVVLAPLAHSSIVIAHMLLEASRERHDHAPDLEAALHGHSHDGATPSHSHSSVAPAPGARINPASIPAEALSVGTLAAAALVLPPASDSAPRGPGARSSPDRLPPPLLSPVLRI